MAYSEKQIAEAVSTVHMNSKRQSKRNQTINYANGDINFIGDCCFAYSGYIGSDTSQKIMLNFNSGPNFLKGEFTMSGSVNHDNPSHDTGYRDGFSIYFNRTSTTALDEGLIMRVKLETATENMQSYARIPLIIPPFTNVELYVISSSTNTNWGTESTFTGKVYSGAEVIQGAI